MKIEVNIDDHRPEQEWNFESWLSAKFAPLQFSMKERAVGSFVEAEGTDKVLNDFSGSTHSLAYAIAQAIWDINDGYCDVTVDIDEQIYEFNTADFAHAESGTVTCSYCDMLCSPLKVYKHDGKKCCDTCHNSHS